MRVTRAACKRHALEEAKTGVAGQGGTRKRAALAGLSTNVPLTRGPASSASTKLKGLPCQQQQARVVDEKFKSQSVVKGETTEEALLPTCPATNVFGVSTAAAAAPTLVVPSSTGQQCVQHETFIRAVLDGSELRGSQEQQSSAEAEERGYADGGEGAETCEVSRGRVLVQGDAAEIAELEKCTQESLFISNGPEPMITAGDGDTGIEDGSRSEGREEARTEESTQSRERRKSVKRKAKEAGVDDEEHEYRERVGWVEQKYSDIDASVANDPQMCATYVNDIYHFLRVAESKRWVRADFMETLQQDINPNMRGILIDWLVEVAEEYKLMSDTLYLTISYVDRYLTSNIVPRSRLQLLGVACMLIAAKYEEIYAPQVEEFCYITDNTYRREEVLEMERSVLKNLRFELTTPTIKSFLRRFLRSAQANTKMEFLGNYLAELTLLDYSFLRYLPSMVAASAVLMAKFTLEPNQRPWDQTLAHYTHYHASELKECVMAIHHCQLNTRGCTLPAIREKYSHHKFKCVATLMPPLTLPNSIFDNVSDSTPLSNSSNSIS
ncbi:hypothetical protein CBR_g26051 [Chara braunii]|uniref:Uncharacterized protein n=1 Tax=Chara braunii TaxID=69332 RepID=A0A388L756_CHABU|nr:hypothetical protein CBR_g26051 [Chara braunii]|eukprot:GBG78114.1 hypothetical protein CBR_g26051 [Chara braunii]